MVLSTCCLKPWIGGLGMILITWIMWKIGNWIIERKTLKATVRRKQGIRQERFRALELKYETGNELSAQVQRIMNLTDDELIRKLQHRDLRAVDVLNAFISKALKIHQNHNCIIEFIPNAHKWAQELDELVEVKGPLHGLPVSIKDNCDIEGLDSTLGLAKKCFQPKAQHSVIVKVLLDLGAVPFCKTNVPQTLISIGCNNPIFGTTTNFLNPALSPGGSSGGESTLIAGGGSILGISSDIGGSVRIPAHFSGLFGLKPTNHRFSPTGFTPSMPNIIGIAGVPGLLTRNVDTLILASKLLLENNRQHNYDHLTLPIPWNNKPFEENRKLRIGYYTSLPYYPLVGDTEEVVLNAKETLEKDGHVLIPFEMPNGYQIMNLMASFSFADNGTHLCQNWKGEEIPLQLLPNYLVFHLPNWLRKVIAFIMELPIPFIHSSRGSVFVRGGAIESKTLMDRMGERKLLIQNLIQQWKEKQLDLLLCPTFPFPAVPNAMTALMQSAIIYTITWNVLDFPAGVVPWGLESGKRIQPYDTQNDFMLRPAPIAVKEAIGMPISVQFIGLPFQDEIVLQGMKILSSLSSTKANSTKN